MPHADALESLTIGSVNLAEKRVLQSGRVIRTKNSKTIVTFFLPFTPNAQTVFEEWIAEITELGLTSADALFPRDIDIPLLSAEPHNDDGLWPCWRGLSQVPRIVRTAFASAGLPVYSQHVFRHMFTNHLLNLRPSLEEFQAFSQSFGHKSPTTTLKFYSRPSIERQAELIASRGPQADLNGLGSLERLIKIIPRENEATVIQLIQMFLKSKAREESECA